MPGFYDVYDLVRHNFGIRGINGGMGASGNVIKLMIDGQPVDFRPTTGNYFGEELIPLQAVERVEIIRGPASALYGANAFLGVINVITRSGKTVSGMRLSATGVSAGGYLGGGAGLLVGASGSGVDVMAAASSLAARSRAGASAPGGSA
jgi:iron complex outermembrane receptor protein